MDAREIGALGEKIAAEYSFRTRDSTTNFLKKLKPNIWGDR